MRNFLPDQRSGQWSRRGPLLIAVAFLMAVLAMFGPESPVIAQETGLRDHDVKREIEFSADDFEYRDKARTAIFSGNVVALQGELRLAADSIKVFFRKQKGAPSGARGTVMRVDASGNVEVRSPTETAHGDWGIYDVDRRIVTLGGAVTLKRGDTLIEGNRLELDLTAGRSRIESTTGTPGKQRVKGIFKPSSPPVRKKEG